jgi:hypothetical protein
MKKRLRKIIILFLSLAIYIVFVIKFIAPNQLYYAGPLLALADSRPSNIEYLMNAITFFFPVVWLIIFFITIFKKENA